MATERKGAFRRRNKGVGMELSEAAIDILLHGCTDKWADDMDFWTVLVDCDPAIEQAWRAVGQRLTTAYILKSPGQRPAAWWHFSAPEPLRKRLSGKGEISPRHLTADSLFFRTRFGLPLWYRRGTVDPDNLPVHESQAAYLKRHALLTPGELKRLTPEDFKPDVFDACSDD